ncbi:EAL domain-containing protein [Chitinivorax sp. PXF-14]|uniref:EAL domain-containing response regulator n=1 Tax=Chitinivorax sp. PXF-14 TaxID=3230488 RepID=UPI0034673448
MNIDANQRFPAEQLEQVVLVVDDTPENLVAMDAILGDLSVQLMMVSSGKAALQKMLEHDVSLVLLDVQMPDMDGYEMAQLMRGSRRTRHIPIIFITAIMRDEAAMLRGYESGAIDYITKPIKRDVLRSKVKLLLELDASKRQLLAAYRRLDGQRSYYESILNAAGEGVVGFDPNGTVNFANPAARRLLNLPEDRLIGQGHQAFYPADAGQPSNWQSTPFWAAIERGQEIRIDDAQFRTLGRGDFPVSLCCSPLSGHYNGVVVVFQDITVRKALELQLRLQAMTDHLTGLNNRSGFKTALGHALARAGRTYKYVALLYIDLDHFKPINDSLGHDAGDQLLQQVAERLKQSMRVSDTISRLGGDEFTVILEDLDDAEDAAFSARKVLSALRPSFQLNGTEVTVGASIGIATYPDCGSDLVSLMQAADVAMYRAKNEGRNVYQFYTPDMNARAKARLMLEQSARHALQHDELVLYYQPQIDLARRRIVGLEALIRWNHPTAGLVSPATFIPLMEETGLIIQVGAWIIESVCKQRQQWHTQGVLDADCTIALNISPRQFSDDNLSRILQQQLSLWQLAPEMIELELTEGMLMQDTEQTYQLLDQLKQIGVRLAIDDFGTGYSSLGYLKRFKLDVLKIDKSFINHLTHNGKDAAIASSIISLAHNLGLNTVAEGVETEAQLDRLKALKCDVVQGYYFAKPMPAEQVEAFVRGFATAP